MAGFTCVTCGETKPTTEFYKNSAAKRGHRSDCKVCNRAKAKRWVTDHPDRKRANDLRWRAANAEKVRAYGRKAEAKWRKANPDKVRAYREEHADEIRAYHQRLYRERREEYLARNRRWKQANPGKVVEYAHRRRATQRGCEVFHLDRDRIWERGEGVCGICGDPCDPADFHVDHIVPLSKGGAHSYENTQVAHPFCNMSKHARPLAVA